MSTTPPLDIVGDPHNEARIIAWLDGEASPFEQEQLQQLCRENPELELFRSRIAALRALMIQANEPLTEPKLPTEKRRKLFLQLGFQESAAKKPSRKINWRKSLLATAACCTLGLIAYSSSIALSSKKELSLSPQKSASPTAAANSRTWAFETKKEAVFTTSPPTPPSAPPPSIALHRTAEPLSKNKPTELKRGNLDGFSNGKFGGGGGGAQGNGAIFTDGTIVSGKLETHHSSALSEKTADMPTPEKSAAVTSLALDDQVVVLDTEAKLAQQQNIEDVRRKLYINEDRGTANLEALTTSDEAKLREVQKQKITSLSREKSQATTSRGTRESDVEVASSAMDYERSSDAQSQLDQDIIRSNPAMRYEHSEEKSLTENHDQAVDEVRRKLYMGKGYMDLGKKDEAKSEFTKALEIDPQNATAQDFLERLEESKSESHSTAHDQTRAKMLEEVASAWDLQPSESQNYYFSSDGLSTVTGTFAGKLITPPIAELSALSDPFSTFSLHVSDASLRVTLEALRNNQAINPTNIRAEEFYNNFDYGDPSPAADEPVTCTTEQCGHPILPMRNLLRISMKTGSSGRQNHQPLHLTILLDSSGSMERSDRRSSLLRAFTTLSSLLQPHDTVTIAGFARTPRLIADRITGENLKTLTATVARTPSEGGTNIEQALLLARDLATRQYSPTAINRIVLLTDGAANLGNAKPDDLQKHITLLRHQGIAFDAAGIGADGLDDNMLETLTRNGNGRYYIINSPEDAESTFAKQLAGAFRPAAENVKIQVKWNSQRVRNYALLGFEKHLLNTEDFRNDSVDAAELAAEESGTALYQIEPLPQGVGDIGEVSIRFRDTATGRMVENKWIIPFDSTAPAFDKAKPSIQFAGFSWLCAEKLRQSAMSPQINLTDFTSTLANISNHYANSARINDLKELQALLNK